MRRRRAMAWVLPLLASTTVVSGGVWEAAARGAQTLATHALHLNPPRQATPPPVDFALLNWYAQLADRVYDPRASLLDWCAATLPNCQLVPDWWQPWRDGSDAAGTNRTFVFVHDEESIGGRLLVMFSPASKQALVVVRGTNNHKNALDDLEYVKCIDPKLGCRLHAGFQRVSTVLWPQLWGLLRQFGTDVELDWTGHSLGGAVAVVQAAYALQEGFKVGRVVTFGQPKLTNKRGKQNPLIKRVGRRLLRVSTEDDMVTRLPTADAVSALHGFYRHFGDVLVLLNPTSTMAAGNATIESSASNETGEDSKTNATNPLAGLLPDIPALEAREAWTYDAAQSASFARSGLRAQRQERDHDREQSPGPGPDQAPTQPPAAPAPGPEEGSATTDTPQPPPPVFFTTNKGWLRQLAAECLHRESYWLHVTHANPVAHLMPSYIARLSALAKLPRADQAAAFVPRDSVEAFRRKLASDATDAAAPPPATALARAWRACLPLVLHVRSTPWWRSAGALVGAAAAAKVLPLVLLADVPDEEPVQDGLWGLLGRTSLSHLGVGRPWQPPPKKDRPARKQLRWLFREGRPLHLLLAVLFIGWTGGAGPSTVHFSSSFFDRDEISVPTKLPASARDPSQPPPPATPSGQPNGDSAEPDADLG